MLENKCKDCQKRFVGCHSQCKDYQKYREELDKMNEIARKNRAYILSIDHI